MEGEFFFVGGEGTSHASPIPSPIALISLLEEGEIMIDGLQIERAVDVQIAVAVDGVTQ